MTAPGNARGALLAAVALGGVALIVTGRDRGHDPDGHGGTA